MHRTKYVLGVAVLLCKAAKNLGPKLRQRVIGATFHSNMSGDSFAAIPRGTQVGNDVQRRKPREWLALDDTNEGWLASASTNYIQTHPEHGIAEPKVLETIEALLALLSIMEQK
ncbi:MAG: hypothetical protein E6Q78_10565 [Rhodoferax sp.]|nr:MAG: hypothetical protein E6Q78_10565 [Rhodoferax sp.]